MEKHKVTHIVYSGLGGTADYVLNLIRGDIDQKFEHHIIFYGVEEVSAALLERSHNYAADVHCILKQVGIDKNALDQLSQLLTTINPKSVTLHVNSLIYHLPKRLPAATRLIFVEHQANHLKTRKEWLWSILAQRKADAVVSLTQEYQLQLRKKLRFLYKTTKNQLIPTGIVLSDYQKNIQDTSKVKFGMVSRINALKDHETLLAAFSGIENANAALHIAGNGELLERLRTKYNDPRIRYHGFIPQYEIPAFLGGLDVYVQASFGETSSIAVMQAQATGLPIIGSAVQGLRSVLTDDFAVLVPTKDVAAMKTALETFLDSSEKRTAAGKSALDYAHKHLSHIHMFETYKKTAL